MTPMSLVLLSISDLALCFSTQYETCWLPLESDVWARRLKKALGVLASYQFLLLAHSGLV